ncbi:MAG: hypothetical protein QOG43_2696 [Actinomycetota bacterium]|jgi:hypothetical protein|nr:hypothetical protein [Actinomycetota bacterium]
MARKPQLVSGFTLGGEQAEADPLLEEAFLESSDFRVMDSQSDPRCFIVGRTGSGKSAALQRLEEIHPDHLIRINPEDLSLPYITDLQVIRHLDSLDVNLDLFWIALWKHVLLVEVIRHRYKVNSQAAKQKFLESLRERLSRDKSKQAALDYLEDFEGRFWCETEERVREITDKFSQRIAGQAGADLTVQTVGLKAGAKAGSNSEAQSSTESRVEQADKYQRIVNETQLGKLNKMLAVLDEDILDHQHYTYVAIDDLDRDWVDDRLTNDLIRCLFRTVLDLKRVKNLKVLVALRTNIFQELDFGRRGGGQEEKFRSLVLQVRWTRPNLVDMLDERVRVASPAIGLQADGIAALLPHPNKTRGNPVDYIIDRTLLRPRDAIAFANECMAVGTGKNRLTWTDIHTAERSYSANRLLALRDEWKPTYPGIDQVLALFRGYPANMTKGDLQTRLDEAMLLSIEPSFPGVVWLTGLSSGMWSGSGVSWFELYQPIANVLYAMGFIGCQRSYGSPPVYSSADPLFMESASSVEATTYFAIHPAFHSALDISLTRSPA